MGPPSVYLVLCEVFVFLLLHKLGEDLKPWAAARMLQAMKVGWEWREDPPSAGIVWKYFSMAGEIRGSFFEAIFGLAFCSPSFLYVITTMQKSAAKIEAIFGFRFFLPGLVPWRPVQGTRWPLLVLRHYIQLLLAHTNKEEWMELPPGNWTTDRLWYVCFWDSRGTQGGYWNWSAILETFCEADCGVGIWCIDSCLWVQRLGLVFSCDIVVGQTTRKLLLTPWSVWAFAWHACPHLGFLKFAFADCLFSRIGIAFEFLHGAALPVICRSVLFMMTWTFWA